MAAQAAVTASQYTWDRNGVEMRAIFAAALDRKSGKSSPVRGARKREVDVIKIAQLQSVGFQTILIGRRRVHSDGNPRKLNPVVLSPPARIGGAIPRDKFFEAFLQRGLRPIAQQSSRLLKCPPRSAAHRPVAALPAELSLSFPSRVPACEPVPKALPDANCRDCRFQMALRPWRRNCNRARQDARDDVIHVRVIAPRFSVAENGDGFPRLDPRDEFVNGEIGSLPRPVHGEKSQAITGNLYRCAYV